MGKKNQKEQPSFKNKSSDSGKIVKKQNRGKAVLPKSTLSEWIEKFDENTLLELGMKKVDIAECLTLPHKEIIMRILKCELKNFMKLKYLFEDIPAKRFSGARKDLNGWTLREVMLLLHKMDQKRSKINGHEGIPWQSIDAPRDGAEKTWKTITNNLPCTMEQVLKRVKTMSVVLLKRPFQLRYLPPNVIWNRRATILRQIGRKILETSGQVNLHPRYLMEVMSPFGRMIVNIRAMDEITENSMMFNEKVTDTNRKFNFSLI